MICVAMGWPDDSFPANAVVSLRKSVDEAAVFVGFDDERRRRVSALGFNHGKHGRHGRLPPARRPSVNVRVFRGSDLIAPAAR
jgi:hypothetical protein